jgi:hypothetical protein
MLAVADVAAAVLTAVVAVAPVDVDVVEGGDGAFKELPTESPRCVQYLHQRMFCQFLLQTSYITDHSLPKCLVIQYTDQCCIIPLVVLSLRNFLSIISYLFLSNQLFYVVRI